jgi:catechol 2,3-dioxygenase-like lactoylglutathione lyase family enzyme
MRFSHLALAVRDQEKSRLFYETYFGFNSGPAQVYEDGVLMLRDHQSFDLALGPSSASPIMPHFVHFGFRAANPGEVHALADRLRADGIELVEQAEETAYVSIKCRDPDGYVVEMYWEPLQAAALSPQAAT